MKIAYFDCPTGIAGDMIVNGLVDAGFPLKHLKAELKKLRLSNDPIHRDLTDILALIRKSTLHPQIKKHSRAIFMRLAHAEAKAHGVPVNEVHFHEVGAVDAIVDIVGACIGFHALGIEEIHCSPINTGEGTIKHSHGILPIPAPATLELLKGIPIYSSGIKKELTTPTGAAIISTLIKGFGPLPRIKATGIGIGSGSYKLPNQQNALRVIIGEKELQTVHDAVMQIEANIDDMDPKLFDKAIAYIMKAGALDCLITPILMKKKRQAVLLSALCKPKYKDRMTRAIFEQTTTFGVRTFLVQREKLKKSFRQVKTKYGKVNIKEGRIGKELITIAPEYEDYKKLADKHHVPITKVYKSIVKTI